MRQTPSITLLDGRIIPCYESKSSKHPVSNHFLVEKTDTRIRIGRLSCPEQAKAATPESAPTEAYTTLHYTTLHYIPVKDMQHFITNNPMTEPNRNISHVLKSVRRYLIRRQE